jgi:hypothetical protein
MRASLYLVGEAESFRNVQPEIGMDGHGVQVVLELGRCRRQSQKFGTF